MGKRTTTLLLSLGVLACQSDQRANPVKGLFSRAPRREAAAGTAVALRFPHGRGQHANLFRLPGLTPVAWRFEAGPHRTRRVVGFAGDEDLVLTETDSLELVALDLTSGRARVVDTNIAMSTLGPTGIAYVVRKDGSVARVERRSLTEWPDTFSILPARIWGAARDRLLALVPTPDGPRIDLLSAGQPPVSQRIPEGPVAVANWGDVVAVGTDSGITIIDPAAERSTKHHRLNRITALEFSPSAHRIYAATATDSLLLIERFELAEMGRMAMPGTITAMRVDPLGRALLARPAVGDSIWLVDPNRWSLLGAVQGAWDLDLPQIAPDGTVLIRRAEQVVAFSLDNLSAEGTTVGQQDDMWLVADWVPGRPALELATEAGPEAEPPSPGQLLYVQVSSTSNEAWAGDLAGNLRRAGLDAIVLPPTVADEPFRVVLGPYPTRDAAEAVGRRLGMPYWIFTRDTTKTPT